MSNIFEPITGSVLLQIKKRQEKISQEFRDNKTIAWLNSNGAFVRLKSSVDIIDENLRGRLGQKNDQPFELASRYTLQGGTKGGFTYNPLTATRETGELEGLSFFPDSRDLASKAGILGSESVPVYGFEGPGLIGLKPMPGIEKVSIKTVGEGYLREATINLRANSIEQLNILDALYFRLGYSILLEWGHTAYFTNDDEFISNPYEEIILSKGKNKSDILKEIEKNREESSYNYDAMFGVIENFQWNLRNDGGYDVTLKIISTGDIVDSLKISSTPLIKDTSPSQENNEKSLFEKSILKSKLHSILIPLQYYSGNIDLESSLLTKLIGWATSNPFLVVRGQGTKNILFSKNDIIPNSKVTLNREANKDILPDLVGYRLRIPKWNFPFSSTIRDNEEYTEIMVYGGVDKDIKIGGRTQSEFFSKDYTPTEYGSYIKLGLLFDLINNLFVYGTDQEKLLELETDLDSAKVFIHPYSVSPDPDICLYHNTSPAFEAEVLNKLTDNKFVESRYTGNLLRIHVNIKYILSVFEKTIDENNNISLKPFLTNLLQGINSCLGGLNKFNIITQTDKNGKEKINIISLYNNPLNYAPESLYNPDDPNNKILEIYGTNTIFKDVSLSSELTNEVTSLISISAQAQNFETNSEGGDAFSYLNEGVEDRIISKKIIKDEPPLPPPTPNSPLEISSSPDSASELEDPFYTTSQNFTTEQEQAINKNLTKELLATTSKTKRKGNLTLYKEYVRILYATRERYQIPESSLNSSTAKNILKDLIQDELSTNSQSSGKSIIIPLNLSFSMQGFSGFKLFNEFVIPTDFLPISYQYSGGEPKFKFVVSGIDHEITSNSWETSISTYMAPLLIEKYIVKQKPFTGFKAVLTPQMQEDLDQNRVTVYAADATSANTQTQQDINLRQQQLQQQANQDNTPFDSGVTPVENP